MPFSPMDLMDKWDGGANTRQLNDAIQRNESPYPLNVQFEGKKISKAPGYTKFGTESDASLVGFNLYNHRILSTDEVLIKVIGGKVKFLDEVTSTWQLLSSTTYTTNKKWWFSSFNGYLYGGNDTDSFQRWKVSSWGSLASGISAGATTLDLTPGEGVRFTASGSGLIEGDTFTWTGKSTDQLTGVTGLSSDHAAGSRVTVEPTAYATLPKGKIGLFYRNRNFVVDATNPNFLYFSKLATNTNPHDSLANFTVAASGSGDAGYIIMDAPILDATIYITGTNEPVLVIFCGNGITYGVAVTDANSTTIGAATPFKVAKEDSAGVSCATVTENDLIFLGKSGTFRAMGYGESSSTLKSTRMSDEISPTTSAMDFSSGNLFYFDRRLFAVGKKDNASENNFMIVKDTNPNGFLFWDYYNANVLCEWKDRLFFLSSVNGNVYEMFSGRSADGNNIVSDYPTFSTDFNVPLILKLLSRIRLQGQISEGCTLEVKVFFDSTLTETFIISGSNNNIVAKSTGVAVGTVKFGTGAHGSGDSDVPIRRSFTAEWNMRSFKYFFDVYLEYYNNEKDVDFLLDKQLLFAEVADPDLMFNKPIL